MVKATWEKTEENKGILTIETSESAVNDAVKSAFKKVVHKVNVPGFRKGKVPQSIFEKRFGVESLYQDALNILLPDMYEEAIKEVDIKPVGRPDIDVEQFEKGNVCIVKATVTVEPGVSLGDYKDLDIPVKDFNVTEDQIDEELKQMQKQQGQLIPVEEGSVSSGDHIVMDFEGFHEGVPFEGGKAENYPLEIGSSRFIPGFEDQLIGMNVGEEKEISLEFPEDYHASELAGKPVTFKAKIKELKQLTLPDIDDEFVKDVSELDTLEELRKDIEGKLQEKAKKEEEEYIHNQLVDAAADKSEVNIPDVMVDQEAEQMIHEIEQKMVYQGMNIEALFGKSKEELKEEWKEKAQHRVRNRLVLQAIGVAEGLDVSEEELDAEVKKWAEEVNQQESEVRKILEEQNGLESIKGKILLEKTVDLLVSHRKIKA